MTTSMKSRKKHLRCAFAGVLLTSCFTAHVAAASRLERGELLYNNHCLACHTEQMHWRERRLVTDLDTLAAQVRRWQGVSRARWNEEDIEAVVRYLNRTVYQFPTPRAGG